MLSRLMYSRWRLRRIVEIANGALPVGGARQLGEDAVAQGAEDLGDLERVAAGIALHLLVLDPLEHARSRGTGRARSPGC